MTRRYGNGDGIRRDGDEVDADERGSGSSRSRSPRTRRRFLALGASAATVGLAGCSNLVPGGGGGPVSLADFRGSGPLIQGRSAPGGTSVEELSDLSGTLTVYLGGGEAGIWLQLFELLEGMYPDFSIEHQQGGASDRANKIIEENDAGQPQADAFLSVDAGTLGAVAEAGAAEPLPERVTDVVDDRFHAPDGEWVGFAGRARAVPYNTAELSASDVPDSVQDFPDVAAFENQIGWAPSYGAFQSFVTAMRQLRGEDGTRQWLQAMLDHGTRTYADEWRVSNRVADGEIHLGFANHYYALRVLRARADAPLELAFTSGDAGALVNVSGAQALRGTENLDLVADFVRHLLSAEAQEFFATRNYAYPLISGVEPVAELPTIDELNPPDVDLTELSDVQGTIDLLREVGVL